MAQYIDKAALVAEIEKIRGHVKRLRYAVDANCIVTVRNACECLESSIDLLVNSIDTLEVKEVIAEQECTCNKALNRIVGGSWNLLCPVNKLGLKTGDKVKVIIKAQKGE